ncbi:MAG TPA: hypothetical protein VFR24_25315 [Candidatus Angelobacter sp.]|nr:hypothetical protein [Candidatus Angelobacter sp.]
MATPEVTKKLLIYHTLYRLNLSFSNIVRYCATFHEAGVFNQTLAKRFQGFTQELQADINNTLLETMHQDELDDWGRFGKVRAAYEKELKDPDDVFLEAEERRQELAKKSKRKR